MNLLLLAFYLTEFSAGRDIQCRMVR